MNNEISEEAKRALADNARRKAIDRLERDGAHSNAAVQRRVLALAVERDIPPADYAKLMHKRIITENMLAFCKKHKVSIDWLMCGDLKGLQRMKQGRAAPAPESLQEKLARLSESDREVIRKIVDQFVEGAS
jgi:hypothetical protein